MDLRPGAYRFEAQSNGNIAAVEVVTVRPDVPLEVYLRLPSGMKDPAAQQPAADAHHEPGMPSGAHDEHSEAPSQTTPEAKPAAAAPPVGVAARPAEHKDKGHATSAAGHVTRPSKEPKAKAASSATGQPVGAAPVVTPAPSHAPAKPAGSIPDNPF
jgi:hypothetical protein